MPGPQSMGKRAGFDPSAGDHGESPGECQAFARLENHYFINNGFWSDGQILAIDRIAYPRSIVQGRCDMTCPPQAACFRSFGPVEPKMVRQAGTPCQSPVSAPSLCAHGPVAGGSRIDPAPYSPLVPLLLCLGDGRPGRHAEGWRNAASGCPR